MEYVNWCHSCGPNLIPVAFVSIESRATSNRVAFMTPTDTWLFAWHTCGVAVYGGRRSRPLFYLAHAQNGNNSTSWYRPIWNWCLIKIKFNWWRVIATTVITGMIPRRLIENGAEWNFATNEWMSICLKIWNFHELCTLNAIECRSPGRSASKEKLLGTEPIIFFVGPCACLLLISTWFMYSNRQRLAAVNIRAIDSTIYLSARCFQQ